MGSIYSIIDVWLFIWDEVLFVSIDSSICSVVIKGESSISDVSFWAKVIPEFKDNIAMVRVETKVIIK